MTIAKASTQLHSAFRLLCYPWMGRERYCLPEHGGVSPESEPTTMGVCGTEYGYGEGAIGICLTGRTDEASDNGSGQLLKAPDGRLRRNCGRQLGMRKVSDLNIASNIPMPAPALLLHEIPRTEAQEDFVAEARQQIRAIISLGDPRFLLIVGPCSIHNTRAGLEYASRLRR